MNEKVKKEVEKLMKDVWKNKHSCLEEFKGRIKWEWLSRYQKLSEDFIREFKYYVNFEYISKYQELSLDFIREFQGILDWNNISEYQKLSLGFIIEFDDKISKYRLRDNRNLPSGAKDYLILSKYLENGELSKKSKEKIKEIILSLIPKKNISSLNNDRFRILDL